MSDRKTVYISVSSDILHYGHIQIMKKAAQLGDLIVGVLTDKVVAEYRRPSLVPFERRMEMFRELSFVKEIVKKDTLSYAPIFEKYHPDFIVHGDEWRTGSKAKVRAEVVEL